MKEKKRPTSDFKRLQEHKEQKYKNKLLEIRQNNVDSEYLKAITRPSLVSSDLLNTNDEFNIRDTYIYHERYV